MDRVTQQSSSEHQAVNFFAIGVTGGTGSGKTTLAKELHRTISASQNCAVISQDSYYRDQSHIAMSERKLINYDHPDALDLDLLSHHLEELRSKNSIQMPTYNFETHCRESTLQAIDPIPVVIVEGILILQHAATRAALNLKIFIDTPTETRRDRRIYRDVSERGRNESSVRQQFDETAQPMHTRFVDPTRQHADLIVSGLSPIDSIAEEVLRLYSNK